MLPVERWQAEPAHPPVIGNIENASLQLIDFDCPRVLPLVKPDEPHLPGVEGGGYHIDVVVAETEDRLVGVEPTVGRESVADLIELRLRREGETQHSTVVK